MSNIRNVLIALGFVASCGSAVAESPSDASFLLTSESGKIALDVLVDNPAVTVFDLTIPIGSIKDVDAALDGCTSGVGGAHVGGCNIAGGEFRMVVFSAQNATLESGRIGSFALPGVQFNEKDIKIRAYDDQGVELHVEVLANIPNLSDSDHRGENKRDSLGIDVTETKD